MNESYITCPTEKGNINISEDVVSVMVAAAVSEVEGVSGLATTAGAELSDFLGKKNIAKGVKVQFEEERITVDVLIIVRYGFSITAIASKVQEAVASAVESMTGLGVPVVNVHISGVAFDK